MKRVIQNFIAAVSGYLTNLTTSNKDTLVDAINEINAKPVCTCELPYMIIAGQLIGDITNGILFFNGERVNTTGAELTLSKVGIGDYIITADKPIFNQTNTSDFYLPLMPKDTNGQFVNIGVPNYIIGYAEYHPAIVGSSQYIYHIKTGNALTGLADGLLSDGSHEVLPPMGYTIEIKIYPMPN